MKAAAKASLDRISADTMPTLEVNMQQLELAGKQETVSDDLPIKSLNEAIGDDGRSAMAPNAVDMGQKKKLKDYRKEGGKKVKDWKLGNAAKDAQEGLGAGAAKSKSSKDDDDDEECFEMKGSREWIVERSIMHCTDKLRRIERLVI